MNSLRFTHSHSICQQQYWRKEKIHTLGFVCKLGALQILTIIIIIIITMRC